MNVDWSVAGINILLCQAGVSVRDQRLLREERGGAAGLPDLGPPHQHRGARDAQGQTSAE